MKYIGFSEVFDRISYPAGEGHIRLRNIGLARSVGVIEATVRTFTDLCEVVTADRILRRNDIAVEWFIPYFPFARHDRRIDAVDGLELELAIELAAELNIVIADPHSDVSGMLPHFPQASVVEVMRTTGAFDNDPVVVIPDAGAAKKAYDWLDGADAVQAIKTRDPRTGKLSGFKVLAEDLGGRPCIIVDDICDGGGTFLGLAAELAERHNAGPLTLVVTHGLFTKGTENLSAAFERIFCFTPTEFSNAEIVPRATTGAITRLPFTVLYEKGTKR